jgi:phage terminase large subunit
MDNILDVNLKDVIGCGYKQFWNFRGRYRVVKGGRGSKKSTTTALWYSYNMMKLSHLKPNTLVIRRYYNTHRDSTYSQIIWAINKLGVAHLWHTTKSPLELMYKPTGQKILFRGLDDPQSITSITSQVGNICWVWWEEGFQVANEDDFNKVDLSIRGILPDGLFKQHTIVLNPWSEKIWIKPRFFDKVDPITGLSPDGDILAVTKNFNVNEYLAPDDINIFRAMEKENPRRYNIEGRGNWGIAEGLVFTNWEELEFDYLYKKRQTDNYGQKLYKELYGMDFGYTNDPTAFIAVLVDEKNKHIFVYDEIYKTQMKNKDIYSTIKYLEYDRVRICCDSSEPRTIAELKDLGLNKVFAAKKGKDSVRAGIQKLQDYKIFVHPRCVNTLVELSNYCWDKDKETNKLLQDPIDEYNHLMDALRYSCEEIGHRTFGW